MFLGTPSLNGCVPSLSRFLLPSISTNVMLQTKHIVACLESNKQKLDPLLDVNTVGGSKNNVKGIFQCLLAF